MLDVGECDDIKHGSATMYALLFGAGEEGKGVSTPIELLMGVYQLLMRSTDHPRPPTTHTDSLAGKELKIRGEQ